MTAFAGHPPSTNTDAPGQRVVTRTPRVPWSPRAWLRALFLLGGVPAQVLPVLIVIWALRRLTGLAGGAITAPLMLLVFVCALFLAIPRLTDMHRHRLRTTAGIWIPPQPPIPNRLSVQGMVTMARSQATWRQLGYHLLAAPVLAAGALAAFGMWVAGVFWTLAFALRPVAPPGSWYHYATKPWLIDSLLTLAGIALLMLAPLVTAGVAALDTRAARTLLGPSRTEELEHKVEHLTQTRAGVVDAADAERRRLERDLHDGTQQRLVSLAMNLGMARAQVTTVEEAQQAIADAHEETKTALAELRNLVRGLHPPVLEDRGLDAALSGVAARLPIPVKLTVEVPRRPAPSIEAVAYFVVSEGLTNITRHAQASQAEVIVQRAGDRIHIIVTDDGIGGADPVRGTGLAGLAKRAESVDGTFDISSPEGGPTMITVDLPCAR
jgi:signal transduction histidine kinase